MAFASSCLSGGRVKGCRPAPGSSSALRATPLAAPRTSRRGSACRAQPPVVDSAINKKVRIDLHSMDAAVANGCSRLHWRRHPRVPQETGTVHCCISTLDNPPPTPTPHPKNKIKAETRSDHNEAQAAVFERPEIVQQFLAPITPEMEQVRLNWWQHPTDIAAPARPPPPHHPLRLFSTTTLRPRSAWPPSPAPSPASAPSRASSTPAPAPAASSPSCR
jgi:hypothetical protein